MKVYVINKHGRPLMPTTPRKARLLLKSGKGKKVYEVVGMQNLGTGVKLKNYPGVKNKVVNLSKVKPIKRRRGLCVIA